VTERWGQRRFQVHGIEKQSPSAPDRLRPMDVKLHHRLLAIDHHYNAIAFYRGLARE
jgi:hypothetical protein